MSLPEMPSETSSQTTVIESPGAILRAAREQCGLQREQVSSETGLSLRYVDALETDNYAILPGQAFARGYLRRYAQLLRIDSNTLVSAFEHLWRAQHPECVAAPDSPVSENVARAGRISMSQLLSWGSLGLLLILLAGTFFWQDGEHSDSQASAVSGIDTAPVAESSVVNVSALPAAEPATAMPVASSAEPAVPRAATVAPPPDVASTSTAAEPTSAKEAVIPVASAQTAAVGQATDPAKPAVEQAVAAGSTRTDSLSFSFTGKSWISVRDATGQQLVYGLKGDGQQVSVFGQPPFSINIGNVAATTLTRNGKTVNLKPYTRGEIASFRLNP